MASKKSVGHKVGRDAGTGQFIPIEEARRRKGTAVVEVIRKRK